MKKVLQFGLLGFLLLAGMSLYQLFALSHQYQKTTHLSELNTIPCEKLPQWEERLKADLKAPHTAELVAWQNAEPSESNSRDQKRSILVNEVLDAMKKKQQIF